ncbi:MAG: ROK family protein [Clostridia bacterium]|nr:ROK family protein [Clostridia bacterium]
MYRIGVDLGGTNIAVGLVDENYRIVAKVSTPTGAERPGEAIVDDIAKLCKKVCLEAGVTANDVAAVGIATPGIADYNTGVVLYSCNLNFRNFPLAELLRERFPVETVHIENDANAAAWGEAVAGAAKGTKNSLMITLGTGVGGGIIIDGKVYSGFNCAGGELGHAVIAAGGRPCGCGRKGCWEAYSSATGLINMTKDKLAACEKEGRATVMTELVEKYGKVNGRVAFDAMRLGDEAGKEVVDEYAYYLGIGIANMINLFQPEVLSIGGGISNEGQTLLDLVEPIVRAEQYGGDVAALTQLRIATLKNDAGIIGAATLGL